MNSMLIKDRPMIARMLRSSYSVALLIVLLGFQASAQNDSMSKSAGRSSGASAGAYGLSELDSVSLFNGSLSFRLPMLQMTGRGGKQIPLMVTIENHWRTQYLGENPDGTPNQSVQDVTWYRADSLLTDYRPGYMIGHQSSQGSDPSITPYPCGDLDPFRAVTSNTRFTFITPEGTTYRFVSKINNGLWADRTGQCINTGFFRGREFITTDGSSAIFITDQDVYDLNYQAEDDINVSGVLMLRDGTRYKINDKGVVTSIRDRNGNELKFTHTTFIANSSSGQKSEERLTGITDSLNRVVTIQYNQQEGGAYGLCDRITFQGFGGEDRIIRVSFKNLDTVLRSDYPPMPNAQPRIATVWLPDGKKYQFRYNPNGELARVELPTGGAFEYDFAAGINDPNSSFGTIGDPYQGVYRRVVEKRVYAKQSDVTPQSITKFSRPETPGTYPPVSRPFPPPAGVNPGTYSDFTNNLGYVDVDHFDPLKPQGSNLLARERHYFYGSAAASVIGGGDDPWTWGKEWQTEFYGTTNGSTVTLKRRVTNTWAQPPLNGWPFSQEFAPENNSHITEVVTALTDANPALVSKQTFLYDVFDSNPNNDFNNLLETREYDYGSSTLLRHTVTAYLTVNNNLNYTTDNDIHLLSLPKEVKIFDGDEVLRSETDYEYDRYSADADGKHANLTSYAGLSGHLTSFNQNYVTRGNVTAITRWILSPRRPTTSYLQYDIAGNVVVTLDPLLNRTEFNYADRYGSPNGNVQAFTSANTYAFPTSVTNAMEQTVYTKYDLSTGQAVDVEDANGAVTSFYYSLTHDPLAPQTQTDELDRLAQVINRDSRTANPSSQTTYTYLDTQNIVRTNSDLVAYRDNKLKSEVKYDGLRRSTETRAYEASNVYIKVEQTYDAMGRVSETTNPYRSAGEVAYKTTMTYDSLGRVIEVKTPDDSIVKTSYAGNVTTVTDQMLRVRQSTADALGRITEVVEDPGTTTGKLNYLTRYSYDTLNHLIAVNQGTPTTGVQARNFEYDSLGRLTSASNPETGEIEYEYYDNGNLKWKLDPRKISSTSTVRVRTTYQYDGLNRVTSKTYNDNITPTVSYYYDRQTIPDAPSDFNSGESIGRPIAVTYGAAGIGNYYSYNKRGEVIQSKQVTNAPTGAECYTTGYSYNASSRLTSQSYPSGRIVNTTYDAAGRIFNVTGLRPDDLKATTYASLFGYTAHGGVAKMKLGNGLWEHTTYDPERLQPKEIGLGLTEKESSALKLEYKYGRVVNGVPDKTRNDGNVQSQTITAAELRSPTTNAIVSPKLSLSESYTYDAVSRLLSATEKNGSAQVWKQSYTYQDAAGKGDQFGNRRIADDTTSNVMPGAQFNPNIAIANNRLIGDQYGYDDAGNLTKAPVIGGNHTYSYDAENRQIKLNGGATTYTYDGEGRRTKKVIVNEMGTFTTIYVYNAVGQLIAENAPYTMKSEEKVRYLTQDHLGNTRIITDGSAVVKIQSDIAKVVRARFDYLPFGGEIAPGIGNRSAVLGYTTNDTTRQKFTGKERDVESGLDYFGARYYSSLQGRFTSPDKPFMDQHAGSPQSWNLYTYVRNNPLRLVDPTGNFIGPGGSHTMEEDDETDDQQARLAKDVEDHREQQEQDAPVTVESATLRTADGTVVRGEIDPSTGTRVEFNISNESVGDVSNVFGENAGTFTVSLKVALPDNAVELSPTKFDTEDIKLPNGTEKKGVETTTASGSAVRADGKSEERNNFFTNGRVATTEVMTNVTHKTATASFSLTTRSGGRENGVNSVTVALAGKNDRGQFIRQPIKVVINCVACQQR